MRRLVFTLLAVFCFTVVSAQLRIGKKSGYEIEQDYRRTSELKKTTLMVLLENNDEIESNKLVNSIKKIWNFNKIDFADPSRLNELLSNPEYSVLTIYLLKNYETSKKVNGYGVGIFLGAKKNKSGDINEAERVAAMSLPSLHSKKAGRVLRDFDFISALIVENLQYTVNSYQKKEVEKTFRVKNAHYYDDGQNKIAKKKILILDEIMPANFSKETFLLNGKLTSNEVEIVGKKEIEKAVSSRDPNIALVYEAEGILMNVYSADNSKLLGSIAHKKMTGNKIYLYGTSIAAIVIFAVLVL